MCSIRKAPIGTMPVSECSLRQKKEWPSPARSGCTPRSGGVAGGAGEAAVAMGTPSDHDECTVRKEKCSTKIIPLLSEQRQEKWLGLCVSREVCAIKLSAIEFGGVGAEEGGP